MKKVLFALLAVLFCFTSCDTEDSQKTNEKQEEVPEETSNIPQTIVYNFTDYIYIDFRIDIVNPPESLKNYTYSLSSYSAIANNVYYFDHGNNVFYSGSLINNSTIYPQFVQFQNCIPRNEDINSTIKLQHNLPIAENGKDAPVIKLHDYLAPSTEWLGIMFIFTYSATEQSFLGVSVSSSQLDNTVTTPQYPF